MTEIDFKKLPCIFERNDLLNLLQQERSNFSASSLSWYIRNLLKKNRIIRVGKNRYCVNMPGKQKYYNQAPSLTMKIILDEMAKEFPLVNYIVWETRQLNEFSNHQLMRNYIVIDVENMFNEFVFNHFKSLYPGKALLNPNSDDIYHYAEDESIIVRKLVTLAPHLKEDRHAMCIEKLIVDVFADKLIQSILNIAEIPSIMENMFEMYVIDETSMLRYADRRGAKERLLKFIQEKTNIKLMSEEKNAVA